MWGPSIAGSFFQVGGCWISSFYSAMYWLVGSFGIRLISLTCLANPLQGNIIQSSKERKVTSCFSARPSPSSQTSSGSGLKQPTTPPRPLTARTWASTTPTILSHAAFSKLCAPNPVSSTSRRGLPVMVSSLEKFLCCIYLKRHLLRAIQTEEPVSRNKTFQMSGGASGINCT